MIDKRKKIVESSDDTKVSVRQSLLTAMFDGRRTFKNQDVESLICYILV